MQPTNPESISEFGVIVPPNPLSGGRLRKVTTATATLNSAEVFDALYASVSKSLKATAKSDVDKFRSEVLPDPTQEKMQLPNVSVDQGVHVIEVRRRNGTVTRGIVAGTWGLPGRTPGPPTNPGEGCITLWVPRGDQNLHAISSSVKPRFVEAVRCKHCSAVVARDEKNKHMPLYHSEVTPNSQAPAAAPAANTEPEKSPAPAEAEKPLSKSEKKALEKTVIRTTRPGFIEALSTVKELGRGAQGGVWLCKSKTEPHQVALKSLLCGSRAEADTTYDRSLSQNEMRGDYVIEYLAVQQSGSNTVSIAMPFYSEGDLRQFIVAEGERMRFDATYIERCGSIALQMAKALQSLHQKRIAHGDIKPDNVLLYNGGNRVVLMDLDTARVVDTGRSALHHHRSHKKEESPAPSEDEGDYIGTYEYASPECVEKKPRLTLGSDVWSLGVMMFIMLVIPEYPEIFHCMSQADIDAKVDSSLKHRPAPLRYVVRQLLRREHRERPTSAQAAWMLSQAVEQILLGEPYDIDRLKLS